MSGLEAEFATRCPAAVDEGPPNLSGHAHSPADYHNREQASAINLTTDEEYWRPVKLAL